MLYIGHIYFIYGYIYIHITKIYQTVYCQVKEQIEVYMVRGRHICPGMVNRYIRLWCQLLLYMAIRSSFYGDLFTCLSLCGNIMFNIQHGQ